MEDVDCVAGGEVVRTQSLPQPKRQSDHITRANRRIVTQLVEHGGALAEGLLYSLRNNQPHDKTDQLKTFLANWDATVLSVPAEWLD